MAQLPGRSTLSNEIETGKLSCPSPTVEAGNGSRYPRTNDPASANDCGNTAERMPVSPYA